MNKFMFGAVYIIEQDCSDSEMKRDLKYMKDYGYNLITLWPVTNPWMAKTSHEWVFEKTRVVLDMCEALGMKAILQLFGQNQAQEFMPDSAVTHEMMIHDERGEFINENCFWVNLNHPLVRDYMDRYFKAAINALKDHPALYGWDVFNEAHFRSDDPITVGKYHEWLSKRYKDINTLNYDWYRRYDNFSQVDPIKRRSAYSIWSSLLPDVEYERFRSENLDDICKFLYDTAKKYDDKHAIIIDGTSSHIMAKEVTLRNNNEFGTANIPDIYGATFYPKSWGKNYKKTPWTMAMYYSIPAGAARKAKKPYIINELQTHTQSVLTPGSEVSPVELYNWIWMCIFTGAGGIQLWRWRPFLHGYQATGRGLTRMDGTPNERGEITKQVMDLIKNNSELFDEFEVKKPVVRFAVSYASRLYFDALLKWKDSFWAEDVEGWYRLFWHYGFTPEFTDLENLNDADLDTPIIVLPSIISISQKAAKQLQKYVKNGGILIADARLGAINDKGVVPTEGIPGPILSEVFGLVEVDVTCGESFILDGKKIKAPFMNQQLEITDTVETLAFMEDGTSAITKNKYGKGVALYFNSFIGLDLKKHIYEEIGTLIMNTLQEMKASVTVVRKADCVHFAEIQNKDKKAMLIINFSDCEQKIVVENLQKTIEYKNIITQEKIQGSGTMTINIPANSTYILVGEERAC